MHDAECVVCVGCGCTRSCTGSFGRVFLAKWKGDANKDPVAIKRLKKAAVIRQKQVDHINSEKSILAALDHPFIVRT